MSNTTNETVTESKIRPEDIHLPPPSFWPILLAFGFTVVIGGIAISPPIALMGIIICFVSAIGWVIEPIHPDEGH